MSIEFSGATARHPPRFFFIWQYRARSCRYMCFRHGSRTLLHFTAIGHPFPIRGPFTFAPPFSDVQRGPRNPVGGARAREREVDRISWIRRALQPVQRGLVFRRVRRSSGGFCRPFKTAAVHAAINKPGSLPRRLPLRFDPSIHARAPDLSRGVIAAPAGASSVLSCCRQEDGERKVRVIRGDRSLPFEPPALATLNVSSPIAFLSFPKIRITGAEDARRRLYLAKSAATESFHSRWLALPILIPSHSSEFSTRRIVAGHDAERRLNGISVGEFERCPVNACNQPARQMSRAVR